MDDEEEEEEEGRGGGEEEKQSGAAYTHRSRTRLIHRVCAQVKRSGICSITRGPTRALARNVSSCSIACAGPRKIDALARRSRQRAKPQRTMRERQGRRAGVGSGVVWSVAVEEEDLVWVAYGHPSTHRGMRPPTPRSLFLSVAVSGSRSRLPPPLLHDFGEKRFSPETSTNELN